jgi:hypothetical protein
MNAERTFPTKHNRFLLVTLALCLALTLVVGQPWWRQSFNVAPAVAYACQGPSSNC